MSYLPVGSYLERNSFLHKVDAFVKLLCTLILLAAVILADTLVGYAVIIALLAVIIKSSSIGVRNALNGVIPLWLFFLLIFFMNAAFFDSAHTLWSWWIFRFSLEGVVQGINVVFRVALAMILGNLLVSTTSPLAITGALESLIFPLKYIGVPIQDVAMILGVAIQFIPTFMEEAEMIRKAQTARGARFESKKFTEKAQAVIPLVVPIFLSAFRRADELSMAMEARGYHRTKRKIRFQKRQIGKREVTAFLVSVFVCAIEIII